MTDNPGTMLLAPFSWDYDERGGYDCMSGGWNIRNAAGEILTTLDEVQYRNKLEAESAARFITEAMNEKASSGS